MNQVEILDPDPGWASEFERIGGRLREELGERAVRIDHIGSTSVPGLPAKDVIDVQLTAADDAALTATAARLRDRGWTFLPGYHRDHQVPGLPTSPSQWRKAVLVGRLRRRACPAGRAMVGLGVGGVAVASRNGRDVGGHALRTARLRTGGRARSMTAYPPEDGEPGGRRRAFLV